MAATMPSARQAGALLGSTMAALVTATLGPAASSSAAAIGPGTVPSKIIDVSAGVQLSHALLADGSVWGAGRNEQGQLGDGTTTTRLSPVPVLGLDDATAVVSGYDHSLALRADGTVAAWGDNSFGQLGDGTKLDRLTPVPVTKLRDVVAVAVGRSHSLALRSDGTVWGWGDNLLGQLGDGTTRPRGRPKRVLDLDDIVAISTSLDHNVALRADGTVWSWGQGRVGQLGDGSLVPVQPRPVRVTLPADVTSVSAGNAHSAALREDGSVWVWGFNSRDGYLGAGTRRRYVPTPVPVRNLAPAEQISTGNSYTVATVADGTVWSWGLNDSGQLGDGTTRTKAHRVQVLGLTDLAVLDAGWSHVMGLRIDGSIWGWGSNRSGGLGDGTEEDKNRPVLLPWPEEWSG